MSNRRNSSPTLEVGVLLLEKGETIAFLSAVKETRLKKLLNVQGQQQFEKIPIVFILIHY